MRWVLLLAATGGLALSGCSGEHPEAKTVKGVADAFIKAWSEGKTETLMTLATTKTRPFLADGLGTAGDMNSVGRVLAVESLDPRSGKASVRGSIPLKGRATGSVHFSLTLIKEDGSWKVDSVVVEDDDGSK